MDTPLPLSSTSRKPLPKVITLDSVGHGPRAHNDYVDSPNLPTVHRSRSKRAPRSVSESLLHKNNNIANENRERQELFRQTVKCPIVEQPVSVTQLPIDINKTAKNSIICHHCGKCKCLKCTERRPLPPIHCGKNEVTSTDVIEKVTCLYCVKAVLYHCCYRENLTMSEDPCACCSQPLCLPRWACLGALSLCVPCLCCYWPLRGVAECVTSCYNGCCVVKGCNCKERRDSTKFIYAADFSSTSSSSI